MISALAHLRYPVPRQPARPRPIPAVAPDTRCGGDFVPLISYGLPRAGQPTVYVCRNFACKMPVTTAEEVAALL